MDGRIRAIDVRFQCVEVISGVIGIQKIRLQVDAADAVVTTTAGADIESPARLTIFNQALVSTTLVRREIRCYTVLRASLAVFTDTVCRVATNAIFVSDRSPVNGQTLVTAHRRAARQPGEHECNPNQIQFAAVCSHGTLQSFVQFAVMLSQIHDGA